MGTAPLTKSEHELWQLWERAQGAVTARVSGDLLTSGLGTPDYVVLSGLVEAGGPVRHRELANLLHWHKSRLTRQLNRLEELGLVSREREGTNLVVVSLTASGKRAVREARPAYTSALRRHLTGKLAPTERSAVIAFLRRLAAT